MNIFVLDEDVKKCARYHTDKHVIKMILETAQLLSAAHHLTGNKSDELYRLTHKSHPCTKWVVKSINNYRWLVDLGLELCQEYTYRYGKTHKTQEKLEWLKNNEAELPDIDRTEFVKCMPDQYKVNSVVESYRNYYIGEKQHIASWKQRRIPNWFEFEKGT
ncbi:pyrimidine dimer DNA glycosylase/endonuclease V [Fuchsiella alkaliacetigena]|uniref:pyrimidine dimer DNA glycosylase/endonuclease V n=1 Tax=Fuchsiella alkaliacetigena TaxID=957042 RepID=UPI00200ACA78|nr:pyrimidine dimer DNA glycosylase/endonuclease V [Fuchsiella alkaliacetigena]MCK8826039.1 pyrimidine dimer DNA glycosylase/endonuclease V [Fuchsiella alkaliacetigena]